MTGTQTVVISRALPAQRHHITELLRLAGLPVDDVSEIVNHFFVASDDNVVIGCIGLEVYGNLGLLRSMAVTETNRNKGIANTMVERLEQYAMALGIQSMFLLTETAHQYFEKKGYHTIDRNDVPALLQQSSEFSHVCPVSATVMVKHLNGSNG